jgi:hypothetical protein
MQTASPLTAKNMSEQPGSTSTLPRPIGAETYQEIVAQDGSRILLTYNDLWMMIVCANSQDGDWARTRHAAMLVVDPLKKRAIADRLWQLEQQLKGLPSIPEDVLRLNLHRAHVWFNERMVSADKAG